MNIFELSIGNDFTLNPNEQGELWKVANINTMIHDNFNTGLFSLDLNATVRIVREGCHPYHCCIKNSEGEFYCLYPYIITPEWLDSVAIDKIDDTSLSLSTWLIWKNDCGDTFSIVEDKITDFLFFPSYNGVVMGRGFRYRHEVQNQYTVLSRKLLVERKK